MCQQDYLLQTLQSRGADANWFHVTKTLDPSVCLEVCAGSRIRLCARFRGKLPWTLQGCTPWGWHLLQGNNKAQSQNQRRYCQQQKPPLQTTNLKSRTHLLQTSFPKHAKPPRHVKPPQHPIAYILPKACKTSSCVISREHGRPQKGKSTEGTTTRTQQGLGIDRTLDLGAELESGSGFAGLELDGHVRKLPGASGLLLVHVPDVCRPRDWLAVVHLGRAHVALNLVLATKPV